MYTPFSTAKTILSEQDGLSCSFSSAHLKLHCTNRNLLMSEIQVIVQSNDFKESEKLYVSERFDIDTMAEIALPIDEDDLMSGTYQLTAFRIGLDSGMIDSVVHTERVAIQTATSMIVTTMQGIEWCIYLHNKTHHRSSDVHC